MMGGASGLSTPDPYAYPDLGVSGGTGYYYTNGLTPRWNAINPGLKTLVLISIGQSNRCGYAGNVYVPTNTANIDNLNLNDGALYPVTGPLLGCSLNSLAGSPPGGNILAYVADKFITAGTFNRVILVPLGITNTSVGEWSTNLWVRVQAAMRRLSARGITPATTGVTFALEWGQGETDVSNATSSATYQSQFASMMTNIATTGFSGRTFVALETYISGSTSATIRGAQAAVVNGTTIFQSGDTDTIGSAGRPLDNIHICYVGAGTGPSDAGTLIYNAMHASGAPF